MFDRLQNSELFALDIDMAIQLLSSFDGRQVYPKMRPKNRHLRRLQKIANSTDDIALIPNGVYYMDLQKTGFGRVTAKMKVEDGLFTVLKGSVCCPTNASWVPAARKGAIIKNNVLMEDVECSSPSTAAWIPTGSRNSGWYIWKTETGKPIDIFQKTRLQQGG
ncbi:MAG: DUF4357 domain-containing protein [Oscillospiraceae bacterium]